MKKNTIIFAICLLIAQLSCLGQTLEPQDSVLVSHSEIQNANAVKEEVKDCKELLADKDFVIEQMKKKDAEKDGKIADLYMEKDAEKEKVKASVQFNGELEAENKEQKKIIRQGKFKLIGLGLLAVCVQVVTIKVMSR